MTDLRQLRESAGLSRILLADNAGVSRFRLYEAERGVRELTPEENAAIDRALRREHAKAVRAAEAFELRQQVTGT
jgi:predicted transcriptional regulator